MITPEVKNRIVEAMKASRVNYSSNAKFATAIGINATQLSRVLNGDLENLMADKGWFSIARRLDVHIGNATEMVTATIEFDIGDYATKTIETYGSTLTNAKGIKITANNIYLTSSNKLVLAAP